MRVLFFMLLTVCSAGLSACSVGPVDFRGKRCQSDAACGVGLLCTDGICDDRRLEFPLRGAFVTLDHPESWSTRYTPSLGEYDDGSESVISAHIAALEHGHVRVGIVHWFGPGTPSDQRLAARLDASGHTPLRWAVYAETEKEGDPATDVIRSHLEYLRDNYGSHPNFLRIDGRFVVFVRFGSLDECPTANRWTSAPVPEAYLVLKVFNGYASCTPAPDAWHQHGSSAATALIAGQSFSISPGFWPPSETTPRLERDLTRWTANVSEMAQAAVKFHLISTFNEWNDGSAVESGEEWASPSGFGQYLDVLHETP